MEPLRKIIPMPKELAFFKSVPSKEEIVDFLRLFYGREAPPFIQFVKYGICGVGALVVHASVYLILIHSVVSYSGNVAIDDWNRAKSTFLPTLIAFLFSNAFVYWLNRKWVFTPGRHSPAVEFLIFTAVNLPGALAGTMAQAAMVYYLAIPKPAALAGFVLPNILINYLSRKFFIFKK